MVQIREFFNKLFDKSDWPTRFFDGAPDAVIVISSQGNIINWNPRAEMLFGWSKSEVLNRPLDEIVIPPRYRELHKKGMEHYLKTGKSAVLGKTIEIQAINKEGLEFDVALSISPTETRGQVVFIGFIRDISEKKRDEEKIRHLNTVLEQRVRERTEQLYNSEQKYRHLFENNPMPMWVLDLPSFSFLDVNEAAILHYGYSREEFLSMSALDIRPPEERALFQNYAHRAKTQQLNYNRAIWKHMKKDGTLIYVEVVAHNVTVGTGMARLILANDVTARVQVEQQLQQFNEGLESRIHLRTIELEAANKEMEAFTYSVSHDLRAPLRAVLGFVNILEEDYASKLDEEARRVTTVIKKNTVKMGRLIDDLLEFSRMGPQFISRDCIHTQAMVREIIEDLSFQPGFSAVRWNVEALPDIQGDNNTIRQVWVNLISNAFKYSSGRDCPLIEIGSIQQDEQPVFFVRDNGVGFDMKYKEKLFKVFQRLHSADEFEGTGIGLALVAKIISRHGGIVWVDAAVDEGACFYFRLPASPVTRD